MIADRIRAALWLTPIDRIEDLGAATVAELVAEREHHREEALAILHRRDRLPVFLRRLTARARTRITAHQDAMRAAHEEIQHRTERETAAPARWTREEFDAGRAAEHQALDLEAELAAILATSEDVGTLTPRWDRLAPAIRLIEGMVDDHGGTVGDVDRIRAYVTELLEAQGVPVRDPSIAYVVLVAAGLFGELAGNAYRKGDVDEVTRLAVTRIAQTLTAALIPYLPPEART